MKQYKLYNQSCFHMKQCRANSVTLTVTSPPYWNAIDYHMHAENGDEAWYRDRNYNSFGETYEEYIYNIGRVFDEVKRVTKPGGFCAIVIGTLLYKGKHFPIPMQITNELIKHGWEFHQDIVWNKVTGGVRRAGSFIQHKKAGYYYPNIMTEYILVFRKSGEPLRGKEEALPIDNLFTKDIANNIWHIAPVPPRTIDHPCPYPQELVRRLVLLYSDKKSTVLDPFVGSGQTAIVALKYNRRFIGYDIEKSYIDLSEERINTPQVPRKYNLIPNWERIAA